MGAELPGPFGSATNDDDGQKEGNDGESSGSYNRLEATRVGKKSDRQFM